MMGFKNHACLDVNATNLYEFDPILSRVYRSGSGWAHHRLKLTSALTQGDIYSFSKSFTVMGRRRFKLVQSDSIVAEVFFKSSLVRPFL